MSSCTGNEWISFNTSSLICKNEEKELFTTISNLEIVDGSLSENFLSLDGVNRPTTMKKREEKKLVENSQVD